MPAEVTDFSWRNCLPFAFRKFSPTDLTNLGGHEYDSDTCQICRDKANWAFAYVHDSCAFSLGTWILGSGETLLGHNRAET